ncbi:uncharacterized protein BHQ10_004205 [Talaromyces amestolkiae]|uniref:Hydrophobic surface binding protein A n=1 Tax=Talaromyces amestolkiae TaxID=1196081 RepID=A0A364KXC2_TALAM|nr:uncharacterized protein BHQ10_004205 [Talaromyces amestolkiae]RAO68193.1 hypothetical protein BHQ10_004205 [Talaromyces amestolkiae]
MKFTGIAAAFALAGAVSAVAIPRGTVSSSLDSTLNELNSLLNTVEPSLSNLVNNVETDLDLNALEADLSQIKTLITALVGAPAKRDVVQGATEVAGYAVNTVGSVAAPAVNEVGSLKQRDIVSTAVGDITSLLSNPVSTVESILPLANNLCSGIESNVPLTQTVGELTALTQGVATYAKLPLSLIQLPTSN